MISRVTTFVTLAALTACVTPSLGGQPQTSPNTSEARLRQRVLQVYAYYSKGDFEKYLSMHSERVRREEALETEEEKRKTIEKWKTLVRDERPRFVLLSLDMAGRRAIAKMETSVRLPNGSRVSEFTFDLWVFETDDWFLDDEGRTTPDHFQK